MQLRELTVKDSHAIADLHMKAFSSFFLTSLGPNFLNVFYHAIIKNPNGIAIGILDGNNLVAFSVGTFKKQGFYTNILIKAGFALLWAAFPQLIREPKKCLRLFISLKENKIENIRIAKSASLLSICVDPIFGNKGYGKEVLSAFERKVFSYATTIFLTTDANDNNAVNSFYKSNGYLLLNEVHQSKRKMNLYYKNYEN
jgi:ribosomal protein S18 acetylase RimI-like enzyme